MRNFQWQHPSDSSMAALESFNYLEIQLILLSNQYTLYGQCQVCITESPGINLYNELYRFQQYVSGQYVGGQYVSNIQVSIIVM